MPKLRTPETQESTMSKLFRHALIDKEWDQKHLSEICNMNESTISRVLKNPCKSNFSTVILLCKKLGIKEIPII